MKGRSNTPTGRLLRDAPSLSLSLEMRAEPSRPNGSLEPPVDAKLGVPPNPPPPE